MISLSFYFSIDFYYIFIFQIITSLPSVIANKIIILFYFRQDEEEEEEEEDKEEEGNPEDEKGDDENDDENDKMNNGDSARGHVFPILISELVKESILDQYQGTYVLIRSYRI